MDQNYRQSNLQILVDLLEEETQHYTRAFNSGKQDEIQRYRANMDALIAEINRRKKEGPIPAELRPEIPPNDYFETSATTP